MLQEMPLLYVYLFISLSRWVGACELNVRSFLSSEEIFSSVG